jgi:hypothetical protein
VLFITEIKSKSFQTQLNSMYYREIHVVLYNKWNLVEFGRISTWFQSVYQVQRGHTRCPFLLCYSKLHSPLSYKRLTTLSGQRPFRSTTCKLYDNIRMDHTSIKMNHLKCNCLLYKIKYFSLQASVYAYAILHQAIKSFTLRDYRAVCNLLFVFVTNINVKNTQFIRSRYASSLCSSCQSKHLRVLFARFVSSSCEMYDAPQAAV